MKKFEYSVAIRTLGTAGDKYVKLLNSIKNSKIQPKKIFVVLPFGYSLPEYQLGTETFVFAEKGMVSQRLKPLEVIETEYVLFCDDDVEFDSDFVEKLSDPLINYGYSCSAGPLLDFFPPQGIKYLFSSLLGGACRMIRNKKNMYVRILSTGGWSYNRNIDTASHKFYDTDSLAGTCFLVNTERFKKAALEDEYWCEKTGYAAFEDRIIIYKLKLGNSKICVVSDAQYVHNDGKTSTKTLKTEPIYAGAFNHYVFWHRFLYMPCKSKLKKIWLRMCINYYVAMLKLYYDILSIRNTEQNENAKANSKGFADAKKYVKTSEYLSLPKNF